MVASDKPLAGATYRRLADSSGVPANLAGRGPCRHPALNAELSREIYGRALVGAAEQVTDLV